MGTGSAITCVFLGILCLLAIIGIGVYSIYINYQYENKIGAYFDNAEDCITPECILIQLNQGYQAIKESGLNENDYGAWIFKKPNNKMIFQYQHLDAIIERANSVQDWKIKVYANNTQAETMKDVYTEKMDNLRGYVTGHSGDKISYGRSDWIAKDSWYFKYHFFIAVIAGPLGLILFLLMVLFFYLAGASIK